MWQSLKRHKMLNLDTVLVRLLSKIHNIFKVEHTQRETLKREVQHLCAEMTRKNEWVDKLEIKVHELKYQC
ncbi:hypothetical protein EMCG_00134 [[Emmonsia] crescens]|uniref:Uncharacterized protein n=1 Tax=[Emmonsia] crescens TaxID=73230 RepID=A0A0G2HTK7_9EURO|nr:hypothetical protein EMCG_00134 [Emmonsia crescens UAMH 3008]